MLITLGALSAVTIFAVVFATAFGSVHIDLLRALREPLSPDRAILLGARLPRVLMGAIVGGVLAAVGAALQALVRNPLAEGGILGISGGGAFGAIFALCDGLVWAELGAAMPEAGGSYRYLKEIYGPDSLGRLL